MAECKFQVRLRIVGILLVALGKLGYAMASTITEEGQWISRVIDFSSQHSTNGCSAQKIIGLPNVYPAYGGNCEAWAPYDIDANQFLEFEFPNSVHVSKIDIYETYNAGGVKAIKCYDVTGTWITLWSTSQVSVITNSRIFSPSFTSSTPCSSNRIRLDIDCSLAGTWVEIDAVRLHHEQHGYKVSSVAIGKNATQTDMADEAGPALAVDGWTYTCSVTASVTAEWTLDLTDYYLIEEVAIHTASEAKSYKIGMGLVLGTNETENILNLSTSSPATWTPASKGPYRHVTVKANPQNQPLKLCELQIKGSVQLRTPPFRVFTGIAMSNPSVRTVSSVWSQIECSSICLREATPACLTAQFDQATKSCALFEGCEHTDDPSNENRTVLFSFAADCFK